MSELDYHDDDYDPGMLDDGELFEEVIKLLRRFYHLSFYLETCFGPEEVQEHDRVSDCLDLVTVEIGRRAIRRVHRDEIARLEAALDEDIKKSKEGNP